MRSAARVTVLHATRLTKEPSQGRGLRGNAGGCVKPRKLYMKCARGECVSGQWVCAAAAQTAMTSMCLRPCIQLCTHLHRLLEPCRSLKNLCRARNCQSLHPHRPSPPRMLRSPICLFQKQLLAASAALSRQHLQPANKCSETDVLKISRDLIYYLLLLRDSID